MVLEKLRRPVTLLNLGLIGLGIGLGVLPLIQGASFSVATVSWSLVGFAALLFLVGRKQL